jgi:hypothetical protein
MCAMQVSSVSSAISPVCARANNYIGKNADAASSSGTAMASARGNSANGNTLSAQGYGFTGVLNGGQVSIILLHDFARHLEDIARQAEAQQAAEKAQAKVEGAMQQQARAADAASQQAPSPQPTASSSDNSSSDTTATRTPVQTDAQAVVQSYQKSASQTGSQNEVVA